MMLTWRLHECALLRWLRIPIAVKFEKLQVAKLIGRAEMILLRELQAKQTEQASVFWSIGSRSWAVGLYRKESTLLDSHLINQDRKNFLLTHPTPYSARLFENCIPKHVSRWSCVNFTFSTQTHDMKR